ncbi:hypothetical protein ES703_36685 [subsurface metagenome]
MQKSDRGFQPRYKNSCNRFSNSEDKFRLLQRLTGYCKSAGQLVVLLLRTKPFLVLLLFLLLSFLRVAGWVEYLSRARFPFPEESQKTLGFLSSATASCRWRIAELQNSNSNFSKPSPAE